MTTHAPRPRLPGHWLAVAVLVGVAVGYTLAVDPVVHSPAQVVYPVVWLGASGAFLWAVRDRLGSAGPAALAAGAGYTLALLWVAGLLGTGATPGSLSVHLGVFGWGPAVVYAGPLVSVRVVPFLVVGYATLGAVAATAVAATPRSAAAGVVGLFACVSCSAPLVAGVAGAVGAGSLAASLSHAQYPLATVAFLLAGGGLAAVARRFGTASSRS